MKNKILIGCYIVIAILGCNAPSRTPEQKTNQINPAVIKSNIKNVIKQEQLVMKKDPVCGMPVWKYLEDTTIYQGKIYGFCGKGCKDEFVKKTEDYIHSAPEKTPAKTKM